MAPIVVLLLSLTSIAWAVHYLGWTVGTLTWTGLASIGLGLTKRALGERMKNENDNKAGFG